MPTYKIRWNIIYINAVQKDLICVFYSPDGVNGSEVKRTSLDRVS